MHKIYRLVQLYTKSPMSSIIERLTGHVKHLLLFLYELQLLFYKTQVGRGSLALSDYLFYLCLALVKYKLFILVPHKPKVSSNLVNKELIQLKKEQKSNFYILHLHCFRFMYNRGMYPGALNSFVRFFFELPLRITQNDLFHMEHICWVTLKNLILFRRFTFRKKYKICRLYLNK